MYLVARQQVFDANFFQRVHHLARRIGVPLLYAFGHIDVHASLDKNILQACVVAKHLVAQGRNQHGIDAVLLNNTEKFVVYLIHFLAHKVMVSKTFLVRDEPKEAELLRLLGGNVLCKPHTALAYAINQCALGVSGVEHRIVNTFYHDAESPQQDGGNKVDGNDVAQMQRNYMLMNVGPKDDGIMQNDNDDKPQTHSISHPFEVDKRRKAYHPSIGVEHAKAYHVEYLIKQQRVNDGHDVCGCARETEKQGTHEKTAKQTDNAVDKENAPIGQRVFTEIPVNKLAKWIHSGVS